MSDTKIESLVQLYQLACAQGESSNRRASNQIFARILNDPNVKNIVKKTVRDNYDLRIKGPFYKRGDIEQVANIAVEYAARTYDFSHPKRAKFLTVVTGAIRRSIRNQMSKAERTIRRRNGYLGKPLTDEQMREGQDTKDKSIWQMQAHSLTGLHNDQIEVQSTLQRNIFGEVVNPSDADVDWTDPIDMILTRMEYNDRVARENALWDAAFYTLTPDQQAFALLWAEDGMTQQRLAKWYGISQQAVAQRVKGMRRRMETAVEALRRKQPPCR